MRDKDSINQTEKETALYWYYQKLINEAKKEDFERYKQTSKRYFVEQAATPFFYTYLTAYKIINKLSKNPPQLLNEYTLVSVGPDDF